MHRLIRVFRAAGLRFSQDGCAFLAQAIAFNAMFAVFPLLILAFATLALVYGDAGQGYAMEMISHLAPSVQGLLVENVQHLFQFRGISGLIALVALLWSGKNLFQTLAYALDRALGVPKGRHLFSEILISLITLPALGLILIVATALPVGLSLVVRFGGFKHVEFWSQLAGYGAGILMVFVVTMLLYTYLPNRRVSFRFGIPGALVATAAWELSQIAFALYTTHVDLRHVFGALATVAILLLWFYYMGIIFLFGAQVSAQWLAITTQERQGDVDTQATAARVARQSA